MISSIRTTFFSTLILCLLPFVASAAGPLVIGQYPFWAQYSQFTPDKVRYELYTHITYSYFTPTPTGDVQLSDGSDLPNLQALVDRAHKAGVKVIVAVGGSGMSDAYPAISASAELRKTFAKALVKTLNEQQLDGVEISWEFPDESDAENLTALMQELKTACDAAGKSLSIAVSWKMENGPAYSVATLKAADWVTVLAYEMMDESVSSLRPNADIQENKKVLEYYAGKVDKSKIVLGTPLYGRSFMGATALGSSHEGPGSGNEGILSWAELVQKFDGSDYLTSVDETSASEIAVGNGETIVFNGIFSTKTRVELVKNGGYGGVFASDLISDIQDPSLSLMVTINQVFRPEVKIEK